MTTCARFSGSVTTATVESGSAGGSRRSWATPDFCAQYVGPGNDAGMEQIYEDPELGFCVLAYNMTAPRTSPPHDHGDSWAVYGQAAGHTDMTVWSASGDAGRLEPGADLPASGRTGRPVRRARDPLDRVHGRGQVSFG